MGVKSCDFKFSVVLETDILKMLESLNVTKATGDDTIPARFLKDSTRVILYPISYLINLSLKTKKVLSCRIQHS